MTALALTIYQNEDWTYRILYAQNGTPVPLTGYTAKMQLRTEPGGELIHTLSTDDDSIVIDEDAGELTLTIPKSVTVTFDFDLAEFDLWITSASNRTPPPLIKGTFTLVRRITEL